MIDFHSVNAAVTAAYVTTALRFIATIRITRQNKFEALRCTINHWIKMLAFK